MSKNARSLLVLAALVAVAVPASAGRKDEVPVVGWAATQGGAGATAYGQAVAAGPGGARIVTGGFRGRIVLDPAGLGGALTSTSVWGDAFVASYTPTGALRWAQAIHSDTWVVAADVAVAADGSFVVCGWFEGTTTFGGDGAAPVRLTARAGSEDAYVARFAADGTVRWVVPIASLGLDEAQSVAVCDDGSVVVGGGFGGDLLLDGPGPYDVELQITGLQAAFVACLDEEGRARWARATEAMDPGTLAGVWAVAEGKKGTVLVAGDFTGAALFGPGEENETLLASTADSNDLFLLSLESDGAMQWARGAGGLDDEYLYDAAATKDGSAWIAGSYRGAAVFADEKKTYDLTSRGGDDGFLVRYDKKGRVKTVTGLGGPANDHVESISALEDGGVAVAGLFARALVLGTDPKHEVSLPTPADAGTDAFVARYDKAGKPRWALRIGGGGFDAATGLAATGKDALSLTGFFAEAAVVGDAAAGPSITGDGLLDGFVLDLASGR